MLHQYFIESALRQYEDLLRESQQSYLVNEALVRRQRRPGVRSHARLLLGRWLVAVGRRMEVSSGLQQSMPGPAPVLLAHRIDCPPASKAPAASSRDTAEAWVIGRSVATLRRLRAMAVASGAPNQMHSARRSVSSSSMTTQCWSCGCSLCITSAIVTFLILLLLDLLFPILATLASRGGEYTGESRSLSCRRALCRRLFTATTEIPRIAAISCRLNCS